MDDLISRAGITETVGFIAACSYGDPINAKDVLKAIDEAPTVAAEPVRHAAWKYCEESDSDKCTNCGFEVSRGYGYNKPDWKHCPNCTARMDLDQEPARHKAQSGQGFCGSDRLVSAHEKKQDNHGGEAE